MYLKKIQIQGFKSFPNKTTIEFLDGITGIVGPNGSGKSNISDAIRWALGEQSSKMLRGNKMEDVIFAGSESRKALGLAEVNLVFDNTDNKIPLEYSEVAVRRRVFRSGESEYSINNSVCRLKDIRDVFMDTGIGKDGYSIIGQGKIDEILSNKPEERRHIFEEAAGIIKYKTRKEEAERKLEKTEENVLRVNDILSELDGRHDYLLKEAEKAKAYKEINIGLRSMELDLLVRKISKLGSKIELLDLKKRELARDKEKTDNEMGQVQDRIGKTEEISSRIDGELARLDLAYQRNNENLLAYNKEKTVLEESLRYSLLESERFEKEIRDNQDKIRFNEEENKKQLDENISLKVKLDTLRKNYRQEEKTLLEEEASLLLEEDEIEKAKNNMISYYNKITDKKGDLTNLNNFKKTILSQSIDIEEELETIKKEIVSLEKKREEVKSSLDQEVDREIKFNRDLLETEKNLQTLDESRDETKSKLEKNNIDLNMNKSQYNMNMNMQENYEGYFRSVKALMVNSREESSLKENILGVVADLIDVDEEYTKAIDVALGSNIQNIVTPDEEAAKYLIDYLKRKKLGRATFLPLNIIKGKIFNLDQLDFNKFGIVGLASDIISYDKKYKNIMENLLGRVIITKDMESSITLARRLGHSTRIVSLDGDVINPGGSMTGGSIYSKGSSILTRKSTLKELEDERKSLLKENNSYSKELDKVAKTWEDLRKTRLSLEEEIKTSSLRIHRYRNELETLENNHGRVKERANKLDQDHGYFNKESLAMEEKEEELTREIAEMEDHNNDLKEEINRLMVGFREKKEEKDLLVERITTFKIEVNAMEAKYGYNEERLKTLRTINEGLEKDIVLKEKSLEENKKSGEVFSKKIKELELLIDDLSYKNKSLQASKDDLNEERKLLAKELKKLKDDDQAFFKKLEKIKQNLNNIELDLARDSVHYENYITEILEGFNLEYRDDMEEKYPDMDYSGLEASINKYRMELEGLGVVNLGSIDEYKGVKERLDFMNKQINDLNKAKGDLSKITKELEEKMELKFMASFKEIKKNFNQVFKALFNGGKADLILEDDRDILNCGIEIKAQPPGKKFQSLSLLSGGERSLTAVALLFSILEMKPAPFCILDEIDAALDESNIDRYTSYLTRFSGETQFIMITHRKRTMEIADTIYGVTMEEQGVSKTISMELSDLENTRRDNIV